MSQVRMSAVARIRHAQQIVNRSTVKLILPKQYCLYISAVYASHGVGKLGVWESL